MKKKFVAILCVVFSFMFCFLSFGYATLSRALRVNGEITVVAQDGIFITSAVTVGNMGADMGTSNVNRFFDTTLDSTVALSKTNGNSTLTYRVTFYNNSGKSAAFQKASFMEGQDTYDNAGITFRVHALSAPVVAADAYFSCNITFSYANATVSADNVLHSMIHFSFAEFEDQLISVLEGTSADNINAVSDNNINYNGSDTRYRWTNWSANDNDRGKSVTMNLAWLEANTFSAIRIYHFIDHYGCDFPEKITVYYFDDAVQDYVELTDYTTSTNFTNAKRGSNGLYMMTINNRSVTIDHGYGGVAPCTTLSLDASITTNAIKIVFDAKADYFVGLMELTFA